MAKKKEQQKYNLIAILGFIFSFISTGPGLVLSIIGLYQAGKRNERGKGLAIAGIIISVGVTIGALVLALVLLSVRECGEFWWKNVTC